MSKTTFQGGTIVKRDTAKGHTWALRYRRDGVKKSMTLGSSHDLPTLAAAKRKANDLVPTINRTVAVYTFGELVEKYIAEEMPSRPQTAASYNSFIKRLKDEFGDVPLAIMLKDLMIIQTWLSDLKTLPTTGAKQKAPRPMSKKTKLNVKAILHRLIECGMRWGYLPVDRNPIDLVEVKVKGIQPKKRLKEPLTRKQINDLLGDVKLPQHVRMMCVISLALGLRISEVLGLRWEDIDFTALELRVERSSVGAYIDATKTEGSRDVMPISGYLAAQLQEWEQAQESVKGWLFGNITTGRPFHRDSLQTDHLAPAGLRNGIPGLGWHTFRHTHIAFLRQVGTAPEVQMMMMRHSDIRTTNEYGRDSGSMELKRPAQQAVVMLMFKEDAK